MDKRQKIFLVFHIAILAFVLYVAFAYDVDDMTLSIDKAVTFNEGWTISWEDGETKKNITLPYYGSSEENQIVVMENTIPPEYFGQTMYFLSADKTLRVFVDGEEVYDFGVGDVDTFGNTPGSVEAFINIPEDATEGKIRIEMCSAFDDYAATISEINIAERSSAVLQFYSNNGSKMIISILVVILGLIFLFLCIIQIVTKQRLYGLAYLSFYFFLSSIYFFIETKLLTLFNGNQTMYSLGVLIIIMLLPIPLLLFFQKQLGEKYTKKIDILLGACMINAVVQIVLQLLGVADLLEMHKFSHIFLYLSIILVIFCLVDSRKKEGKWSYLPELVAVTILGLSCVMDLFRAYFIKVGDFALFSRIGTVVFGGIMLFRHIAGVANNYSGIMKREMEQMEEQNRLLEKVKEEAMAANYAKSNFLANMSHEIRTPINTVLGMDEMIIREAKDTDIVDYALDIQHAGKTLLTIINDILDYSKIESGNIEIHETEYDFSSLIHDTAIMASFNAEEKGIDFIMSVDENLPSRLRGDDMRIRQVLDNLLSNAVKYTKTGFVHLVIKGETKGDVVTLTYEVIDTGIGIKRDDIEKMLESFERIEQNKNRNIQGLGLGLNITSELVKLMNGKLSAHSEYGKGTNMVFTIDQKIINGEPIGNIEQRVRERDTNIDKYKMVFVAPDANILVVDDNDINRRVFKSLLKKTKIKIDEAESGIQCLEMVQQKHYDIIFLDHMMPNMDGVETLHVMKELDYNRCKGTPVIVLTANAVVGAREEYLEEGFDDYMSKPVESVKLENMVQHYLPSHMVQLVEYNPDEILENLTIKQAPKEITDVGNIDGVDLEYAFYRLQDTEVLMTTIHEFYRMVDIEADNLDEYFEHLDEEGQLELYRIKVHAMKSSAALIGAMQLSGVAKTLEYAARDGKIEVIRALHREFIDEWRNYRSRLDPVVNKNKGAENETDEKAVVDKDDIIALLNGIDISLQIMDVDKADELMEEIQKYRFTADVGKELDKLAGLLVNLEVEKVTEQVKIITDML